MPLHSWLERRSLRSPREDACFQWSDLHRWRIFHSLDGSFASSSRCSSETNETGWKTSKYITHSSHCTLITSSFQWRFDMRNGQKLVPSRTTMRDDEKANHARKCCDHGWIVYWSSRIHVKSVVIAVGLDDSIRFESMERTWCEEAKLLQEGEKLWKGISVTALSCV